MTPKDRRVLKLAEITKRILGQCLSEYPLVDPQDKPLLLTITQVVLSKDYGWADVYVAPLYGTHQVGAQVCLDVIKERSKFLRHYLAQNAQMKRTPQLRFVYDESFDRAMRCEQLLDEQDYGR